jgi:cell division transport system permease protein
LGWLARHAQVFLATLGELSRAPIGTLMTVLLVGISMALPAALYLVVENARAVTAGWHLSAQISVFLRPEAGAGETERVARSVEGWPEVAAVRVITREEALAEYKVMAGMAGALEGLEVNPLPFVLVVSPREGEGGDVGALVERLAAVPGVDAAQFDLQWVRRLEAILRLAERAALVLAVLLGLGVLLVVANTTRLAIQGRRAEIEIGKLFGATDAFVRRPFLYTGLWYGVLGAIAGWLLLAGAYGALRGPVAELARLYGTGYSLRGLGLEGTLVLLGTGAALGLLGAWAAVGRHLRAIEP